MQWKKISEFNPNNYKEDDTFNILTKDGYYDLVTLEIINNSYCEDTQPFLNGDATLYYRFNNEECVPIKFETISHFMKLEQPEGEQP
jgi:hypothetical protein